MRLMIIGNLNGELTTATKIATKIARGTADNCVENRFECFSISTLLSKCPRVGKKVRAGQPNG